MRLHEAVRKSTARVGAALRKLIPKREHEVRETLTVDVFYPDHEQRTESAVFRKTKAHGHLLGLRCAFSGQQHPEYHHVFIEWADTDSVDWETMKRIGTGEIKELPVLDPVTDEPTGETFPVQQSWAWIVCKIAAFRGFDWNAFDPTKPEQFVDSMANMLPLSAKFHRHRDFGWHMMPFPLIAVMGLPRKRGFIFNPSEESKK